MARPKIDPESESSAAGMSGPPARSIATVRAEHKAVKARLRDYENAFEKEHGRKPRKKRDWAPVMELYEQYETLKLEEKALETSNA